MAICVICEDEYSDERAALGKAYCMKRECIAAGQAGPKFVEVGYGKSGVDLQPSGAVTAEDLAKTGNRGR